MKKDLHKVEFTDFVGESKRGRPSIAELKCDFCGHRKSFHVRDTSKGFDFFNKTGSTCKVSNCKCSYRQVNVQ